MFKIHVSSRSRCNRPVAHDICASFSPKRNSLFFSAGTIRALGDPREVYLEYDEDTGFIRLRSAILDSEPGKRIVQHYGASNTPRLLLSCVDMRMWIQKHSDYVVGDSGNYLVDGAVSSADGTVLFDLSKILKVA